MGEVQLAFCGLISQKGMQNIPGVTNKVFEEALSLPSNERMSLVEKLLTSLNLPIQADIDRLWAEEAEKIWGRWCKEK